jgi:hypothetical protein
MNDAVAIMTGALAPEDHAAGAYCPPCARAT